jgi:hypothetical protein
MRSAPGMVRALHRVMNDNTTEPPTPEQLPAMPKRVENSTDATRGEPLAMRANKRKVELEAALAKLPAGDRARGDIENAVASIDALLTGDVDNLAEATAAELSRLLEGSKHLAEIAPVQTSQS